MTLKAVRRVVLVVCVLGIAGMIVTSITDHVGAAITFGLVTAGAILCSIVATSVTGAAVVDEVQAARVEELVDQLVEAGVDERALRRLVGAAVKLGKRA
jgi:hypothetical protein